MEECFQSILKKTYDDIPSSSPHQLSLIRIRSLSAADVDGCLGVGLTGEYRERGG